MAPQIKIYYFNMEGRAEKIRLTCVLGGVEFEDVRMAGDWPEKKKTLAKFGQAPFGEVDGKPFAQSGALLRYCGVLGGLYPTNDPMSLLRIEEVIALCDDLNSALVGKYAISGNPNLSEEEKKTQLDAFWAKFTNDVLPVYLGHFEKVFAENTTGSGFVVGDKVTIADAHVFSLVRLVMTQQLPIPKSTLDSHPNLVAHHDKIMAIPSVTAWYAKTH